jgi:hypothetical protein
MVENKDGQNDFFRWEWYTGIVCRINDNESVDVKILDRKSTREIEHRFAIETGTAVSLKPWETLLRALYRGMRKLIPKTVYNTFVGGYIEYFVHSDGIHRPTSWFMKNDEIISPLFKQTAGDDISNIGSIKRTSKTQAFMLHGQVNIFSYDMASLEVAYFALDGNLFLYKEYSKCDLKILERRFLKMLLREMAMDTAENDVQAESILLDNIVNLVEYKFQKKRDEVENTVSFVDIISSNTMRSLTQIIIDEDNTEEVAKRRTVIAFESKKYMNEHLREILVEYVVAIITDLINDIEVDLEIKDRSEFIQKLYANVKTNIGGGPESFKSIKSQSTKHVIEELQSYMEKDMHQIYDIQEDGSDNFCHVTDCVLISPCTQLHSFDNSILKIIDEQGKVLTIQVTDNELYKKLLDTTGAVKVVKPLTLNDIVKCKVRSSKLASLFRLLALIVSASILVVTFIVLMLAINFARVIFSSLIIWRSIDISGIDFVQQLQKIADELKFQLNFSLIEYLLLPFVAFFKLISLINIDFSQIAVTCAGSQSPLELIVITVIFLSVVLVIESKFSIFFKVFLRCVNFRFIFVALQFDILLPATNSGQSETESKSEAEGGKHLIMGLFRKVLLIVLCSLMGVLGALDPMQRILQYFMGLAPISEFTKQNGVAHLSTPACDDLDSVRNIDKCKLNT